MSENDARSKKLLDSMEDAVAQDRAVADAVLPWIDEAKRMVTRIEELEVELARIAKEATLASGRSTAEMRGCLRGIRRNALIAIGRWEGSGPGPMGDESLSSLSIDFQSFGPGETPRVQATVMAESHEDYEALRKEFEDEEKDNE